MPRALYESVALGGPLDGIRLASGLGWDGRIISRRTEGHSYYHAGYYMWEPIKEQWIWYAVKIPREPVRRTNVKGKPHDRSTYKVTR